MPRTPTPADSPRQRNAGGGRPRGNQRAGNKQRREAPPGSGVKTGTGATILDIVNIGAGLVAAAAGNDSVTQTTDKLQDAVTRLQSGDESAAKDVQVYSNAQARELGAKRDVFTARPATRQTSTAGPAIALGLGALLVAALMI